MTTEAVVLDILADVAGTDDVRSDTSVQLYRDHVLDSLQTVELIVRLSDRFRLEISPAEFDRAAWATPSDVVRDVERRLRDAGYLDSSASPSGP
jgi:D-alanine--poly(phosphoribitol) ligase subunit 2